jgi:alkanesulfonate monooxygenase SsuD/methylene tetrahydromethanopterin reductase-like flavin-dependent oxidoreductase (luciferase family)
MGLPYVLAHQLSEAQTHRLLDLYRARFRPSEHLHAPKVILTVTVVAAAADVEARRLALPQLHHLARLGGGTALGPMATVEGAARDTPTVSQAQLVDSLLEHLFIGEAGAVADRLTAPATRLGVDEVMVGSAGGGSTTDPLDRFPSRERTLELLAAHLLE